MIHRAVAIVVSLLLGSFAPKGVDPAPNGSKTKPVEVWISVSNYTGEGNCVLHIGDSIKTLPDFTAGPWVKAWGGFAIVREQRLYALTATGKIVGPKGKISPAWGLYSQQWAVSPDGTLLAEYNQMDPVPPTFAIREVKTGKVLAKYGRRELQRAFGAPAKAATWVDGVAWTPSGDRVAFSHGFGGELDNSGFSEPRLGVWNRNTKRLAPWAKRASTLGGPIAWVSEDQLLVEGGEGNRLVQASKLGRLHEVAAICGWDGVDILQFASLGRDHQVRFERWTSDFRRRKSARILPNVTWVDVNSGVFFAPQMKE